MPRVLLTPTTLAGREGPHLNILQQAGLETGFPEASHQLTEGDLLRELPEVAATVAGSEPYTRKVLEQARNLKVIARAGVGFDAVDVPTATELGIAVTITPGTNHDSVAEHTFALMLALAKHVTVQDRVTKAGQWRREPTLSLRGRTLGILGLGRIGRSVARLGKAFQMRLIAYEPLPLADFVAQLGIELMPMDRVLQQADFVTIHVPLAPETRHLINRKTLALMKPTSYLINTARGSLVSEADLAEALQRKQIAGAALDVFEVEPCRQSPLFGLENVVLTPHTAGVDSQSVIDMAVMAAECIVKLSRGDWPAEQIVNPEVRGRLRKW